MIAAPEPKTETPAEHSIRRAGERYKDFKQKAMTELEYITAVKGIRRCGPGYSLVHSEKDGKQSVWRCFVRGVKLYATYCRQRKIITTFLPPEDFATNTRRRR